MSRRYQYKQLEFYNGIYRTVTKFDGMAFYPSDTDLSVVNAMDEAGWELVTSHPTPREGGIALWFRRQINTRDNKLSELQYAILKSATSPFGAPIYAWEDNKTRQALQLVEDGLLTKKTVGRENYVFFTTVQGRAVLDVEGGEDE